MAEHWSWGAKTFYWPTTFNWELRSKKLSKLINTLTKTDHVGHMFMDIAGGNVGLGFGLISKSPSCQAPKLIAKPLKPEIQNGGG